MKYLLIICLSFLLAFSSCVQPEEESLPNVILIMADDVGMECFPAYGGEDYETPNLDMMAEQGILFENCYSQPLCTPSRVKIMTGKYQYRNYTHFGYLRPDQKTFGHLMKEAGYHTAVAGKWQLNGLYDKHPGHDDPARPHHFGFDEYHLWQLTKHKNEGERFWNTVVETNGKVLNKENTRGLYGPDLHQVFVCDFMERYKDEPFFIYYPMVLVHNPFLPTPDSEDRDCKDPKRNFVDMVKYTDKIIGKIIAKTEELGIAENTLIIFTADNGTNRAIKSRWNGQDYKGGKGTMKNAGTHVPMYAYWKGTGPQGIRSKNMVDFSDFYATLAELSQQEIPAEDLVDGISFLPVLSGKEGKKREWNVCHYTPYWNQEPGRYVRDDNYKLYQDGRYYFVANDIDEINNLSLPGREAHDESRRTEFQAILDQMPPFPENPVKQNENRPIYPQWDPLD